MSGGLRRAGLSLLVAACAWTAVAEPRPLAEALRELVRAGLEVIWSEELVRPELTVVREPAASDPVERLRELLAPHGLAARRGPGGGWLVVRAPRRTRGGVSTVEQRARPVPATGEGPPTTRTFDEIVVTPQQTSFGVEPAGGETGWSAEEVAALPHFGDEPLRLVHRLTGVAADDTSARFHLHGSTLRQVGFRLDGLAIDAPYHLEGLQGLFSVVAPEAVARLDLVAGGFSAAHGNQLAGYVDVTTHSPQGPLLTAGVSLVSAQVLAGGRQRKGGSWLVSARQSYVTWLLDQVDVGGDFRPSYGDLYGKWAQGLGSRSLLAAHALWAKDSEHFANDDEDLLDGGQSALSGWLTLDSQWSPRLSTRLLFAAVASERERRGFIEHGASREHDRRESDTLTVGFELGLAGERASTSAGFSARRFAVDFDHDHVRALRSDIFAPRENEAFAARLALREDDLGAFVVERLALGERTTAEVGLRWDRQSTTGEEQWSPRLGLVRALGPRTTLRAAWGLYHQAQAVDELAIEDADLTFYRAERAEHRLLALDHRFARGLSLRLTAYDHRLSHPRPRYENLFDPIELFPGLGEDRVRIAPARGRARGLDLLLRGGGGDRFRWSLSYSSSKAEDRLDGAWVPRSWDQPHAGVVELDWALRQHWRFHLSGVARSGWPTTELQLVTIPEEGGAVRFATVRGPRNGARFDTYQRLDLRLSRTYETARGSLELFFDVFNLFNRDNQCCVDDVQIVTRPDGSFALALEYESRLPRIPSFGLTWRLR